MTIALNRVNGRRAEVCRHGIRPGECQTCTPRRDRPPPKIGRPAGLVKRALPWHVYRMARQFDGPFSLEKLTVACWLEQPRRFGLRGWADTHPDVRKVTTALYGSSGLLARGLVRRVGGGRFEAVREGGGT